MDINNFIITAFVTVIPLLLLKYKGFLNHKPKIAIIIVSMWSLIAIILSPFLLDVLKYQKSWATIISTSIILGVYNFFLLKGDIDLKKLPKLIIVITLFFCSSLFQLIPIKIFSITAENINVQTQGFLSLFSNICLLITIIIIYWKDLKNNFSKFIKNFNPIFDTSLKYWLIGLFVMMGSNILINTFFPQSIAGNEESVQQMLSAVPLITFICAGLIAPIVEELTFRKAFQDTFKGKWLFILTSGIVFGALHVVFSATSVWDFLYLIPYSSLGISFAYMLHKTDNIFSPIMMHLIHNVMLTSISIFSSLVILL